MLYLGAWLILQSTMEDQGQPGESWRWDEQNFRPRWHKNQDPKQRMKEFLQQIMQSQANTLLTTLGKKQQIETKKINRNPKKVTFRKAEPYQLRLF